MEFSGCPLTFHLSLLNRKQGSLAFSVKNLVLCPFALELRTRFFVTSFLRMTRGDYLLSYNLPALVTTLVPLLLVAHCYAPPSSIQHLKKCRCKACFAAALFVKTIIEFPSAGTGRGIGSGKTRRAKAPLFCPETGKTPSVQGAGPGRPPARPPDTAWHGASSFPSFQTAPCSLARRRKFEPAE